MKSPYRLGIKDYKMSLSGTPAKKGASLSSSRKPLLAKILEITDSDKYFNLSTNRTISSRLKSSLARYIFVRISDEIRIAASTQIEIDDACKILAPDRPDVAAHIGFVPVSYAVSSSAAASSVSTTASYDAIPDIDTDTDLLYILGPNGSDPARQNAMDRGLSLIDIKKTSTGEPIRLFPHQRGIVNSVLAQKRNVYGLSGVLLALEMGLGKTITSLTIALASRQSTVHKGKEIQSPILIVVTKSLMSMWREAFDKFFTDEFKEKILYLHGEYMDGIENIDHDYICSFTIIVTTYDFVKGAFKRSGRVDPTVKKRDHKNIVLVPLNDDPSVIGDSILFNTIFSCIIYDEVHNIASPTTRAFEACMAIPRVSAILLSGTPVRNTDKDFWTLCRLMGYHVTRKNINEVSSRVYSMSYEEANIPLPEKTVHTHLLTVSEDERKFQEAVKAAAAGALAGSTSFVHVLAMINMLRQAMNSCYTVKFESPPNRDWYSDVNGMAGLTSTKIEKVIEILKGTKKGEKTLVFSSFLETLSLVSMRLDALGYNKKGASYFYVDGSTDIKDREDIVARFKTRKNRSVLLMSKKVGGEGWNLECATTVIIIEPWWCPAVDDQCIRRAHRIGQTRHVDIHYLYIKDSIEDYVRKTVDSKRELAANVFTDISNDRKNPNREMLSELLK